MSDTKRVNRGRSHSYLLDGAKVPGVTTIIGNGLPKPALMKWGIRTVANYAVDRWDELAEKTVSARLKELEGSPYADRDAAAKRGTEVHKLAERLALGEEVDVPDAIRGHVEAAVKFLDEWDVHPVITEAPVFSRRHRYGGTCDMVADLADGRTWLLDWKTNRSGPFGDTAYQLAAYANADIYLDGEQEHPVADLGIQACGVVWIRADGYDLYEFRTDQHVFRQFLYIAQVAQAVEESRDYKGEALVAPTRQEVSA